MAKYSDEYAHTFEETVKRCIRDKKTKRVLAKALFVILENPYHRADKAEGQKGHNGEALLRKHVCGDIFRLFYSVDEQRKKVKFYFIRPKDKRTYKHF